MGGFLPDLTLLKRGIKNLKISQKNLSRMTQKEAKAGKHKRDGQSPVYSPATI